MELVIVTGLSGAGKSRAMDVLEDIGYYCVDNMPPKLIPTFLDLMQNSNDNLSQVAIATDVRGGDMFKDLFETLELLRSREIRYKILYMDCNNEMLLKRYKLTRRKHPLVTPKNASIERAIELERSLLSGILARADYVLDTSFISNTKIKERIIQLFQGDQSLGMKIYCMSFGFKFGIPSEADLVFDVRCLPNPFYVDELKEHTGLEAPVREYVLAHKEATDLIPKLTDLVDYLVPLYRAEGKSQLCVCIGCTGGRHRSVVFAELLKEHLEPANIYVSVSHRDIEK